MFDLAYAIQWYLDYKTQRLQVQLDEARDDDTDWDEEYRKYKAKRMALEAHKESGQLLTVEEAEQAMLTRLIQIRDALKNVPLSWMHQIIGIEDKKEAQEKLEELLDDLLKILSNQPDDVDHVTEGEEVVDLDIEDVSDIAEVK